MTTALLLLFLLANGAALALPRETPKCQQDLEFWCQDAATATRCGQLQFCLEHSWDELPEGVNEWHPLVKCWICVKVISKIKKKVSNPHNVTSVTNVIKTICSTFPKGTAAKCHQVVDRYIQPIAEGLAKDLEPRAICTNMRMCRAEGHPAWQFPGQFRSPEDAVGS